MKIAIVPHGGRPRSVELAKQFVQFAQRSGIELVASEADAGTLDVVPTDFERSNGLDLIVAIGGDGTVLRAVRVALRTGAPVYGINAGNLGFLAEGEPSDVAEMVGRLADGNWTKSDRMMVQASLNGSAPVVGLNDVVIQKIESQRTVKLAVSIDEEPFLTYSADGVVVATPTGSTAYNLSAGGPLVDPEINAILMTPVAPHSLFSRAVVFPPGRVLSFEVLDDRRVGVNVDGIEVDTVDPGGVITVERAEERVSFVSLSGRSYPSAVKRKFSLE